MKFLRGLFRKVQKVAPVDEQTVNEMGPEVKTRRGSGLIAITSDQEECCPCCHVSKIPATLQSQPTLPTVNESADENSKRMNANPKMQFINSTLHDVLTKTP